MPDLLLELFSEEIPARMQVNAAKELQRLVVGALSDRGLLFESAKSFSGPRRLTLAIFGLPAKQPDVSEELKGPKVDAPQAALDGFLRKTGLTKDQLKVEATPKGDVYLAVIARKGRATEELLAEILPDTLAKLPWPKSMRFPSSALRWVRPLHSVLCTFDGEVVPFYFAGIESGNLTRGHRFLAPGEIEVRRFEDYEEKLNAASVVLDAAARRDIIWHEAKHQAFALGLELIEDEALLDEVAGLAEWPVVLTGQINDAFMDVPPEILQTSMRTHQKYFALRDPATGKLANRFILVANMVAHDGGNEIVAGNERVLRARLSDAKFFWDQDRKTPLADRVEALKGIVFHAKLGTQCERVERIEALAGEIASKIGADVEKAKRAARLCKADLTTGVVGEFPELQGAMGRYYALHDGEDAEVADAIRDHYKPVGPSDAVPTSKISIAVALADKLDQLVGFFAIDERPTGSGDPYALRRGALGIIRIVLSSALRLSWRPLAGESWNKLLGTYCADYRLFISGEQIIPDEEQRPFKPEQYTTPNLMSLLAWQKIRSVQDSVEVVAFGGPIIYGSNISPNSWQWSIDPRGDVASDWLRFLADRLKVALREKGTRHDLIDAVFSLGNEDDLVRLVARVEALQAFLKTEDGANLLAGYKRAANILRIERKKEKSDTAFSDPPDPEQLQLAEEKALYVELATAKELIAAEIAHERFAEAMSVMARLRAPVDRFFDTVTVNDPDQNLRENRLRLLSHLVATAHSVADFSKIEG